MFCPVCGAHIIEGEDTCRYCGYVFEAEELEEASAEDAGAEEAADAEAEDTAVEESAVQEKSFEPIPEGPFWGVGGWGDERFLTNANVDTVEPNEFIGSLDAIETVPCLLTIVERVARCPSARLLVLRCPSSPRCSSSCSSSRGRSSRLSKARPMFRRRSSFLKVSKLNPPRVKRGPKAKRAPRAKVRVPKPKAKKVLKQRTSRSVRMASSFARACGSTPGTS